MIGSKPNYRLLMSFTASMGHVIPSKLLLIRM